MTTLTLRFDGASRGNPGKGSSAAVLFDGTGTCIGQAYRRLEGKVTNNEAEYTGLLAGLRLMCSMQSSMPGIGGAALIVEGDSKLVIEQVFGSWKCKDARMKALAGAAKELVQSLKANGFRTIQSRWIPRERNSAADALCNAALDDPTKKSGPDDWFVLGAAGAGGGNGNSKVKGAISTPKQMEQRSIVDHLGGKMDLEVCAHNVPMKGPIKAPAPTPSSFFPMAASSANKFKVHLRHPDAIMPKRATSKDAGCDVHAVEDKVIPAGKRGLVSTGLTLEIPDDSYVRVAPRSGLSCKHGIDIGAGVVDAGYTGIVHALVINNGTEDFVVTKGDRIAQIIVERIYMQTWTQAEEGAIEAVMATSTRGEGGFGSTGV
jgi:dUTP pyrophosphatase